MIVEWGSVETYRGSRSRSACMKQALWSFDPRFGGPVNVRGVYVSRSRGPPLEQEPGSRNS